MRIAGRLVLCFTLFVMVGIPSNRSIAETSGWYDHWFDEPVKQAGCTGGSYTKYVAGVFRYWCSAAARACQASGSANEHIMAAKNLQTCLSQQDAETEVCYNGDYAGFRSQVRHQTVQLLNQCGVQAVDIQCTNSVYRRPGERCVNGQLSGGAAGVGGVASSNNLSLPSQQLRDEETCRQVAPIAGVNPTRCSNPDQARAIVALNNTYKYTKTGSDAISLFESPGKAACHGIREKALNAAGGQYGLLGRVWGWAENAQESFVGAQKPLPTSASAQVVNDCK